MPLSWPDLWDSTALLFRQDYFTRGRSQPLPDASQDYRLLNASEVGGYTELMFQRPRDTRDDEDLLFLVSLKK